MPLYEYECRECHRRTEKIQKFSDAELTVCPFCSGKLERTLTAPAFHFAGGGWYKDLYSSAKPKAAKSSDGSPAAPAASGTGGSEASAAPSSAAAAPAAPAAAPASTPSTPAPSKA